MPSGWLGAVRQQTITWAHVDQNLCRHLASLSHKWKHIQSTVVNQNNNRWYARFCIALFYDIDLSLTYVADENTVYPKKYAQGLCFAVLCCGYILTDFPISIRLTSLALWQSNDCPSASKATLMNMEKYFMWIHYERLHNHNKAKHNKTVCIFLGIYCIFNLPHSALPHRQNQGWEVMRLYASGATISHTI